MTGEQSYASPNTAGPSRQRVRTDWTDRILRGDGFDGGRHPSWLEACHAAFRHEVLNPAYPCFFGTVAERKGEMFYGYAETGALGELPETVAHFVRLGSQAAYRRNNLALFFKPEPQPPTHQAFQACFWSVLQYLHDHDPLPESAHHCDPESPDFEFTFADCQMFVVGASPSYRKRRSRCLGPGMVLLFQPRAVFIDIATSQPISASVRGQIRQRMAAWDQMEAHPDLGFFGEAGNLEWKQYCLPDDNTPAMGACPFLSRRLRSAKLDS